MQVRPLARRFTNAAAKLLLAAHSSPFCLRPELLDFLVAPPPLPDMTNTRPATTSNSRSMMMMRNASIFPQACRAKKAKSGEAVTGSKPRTAPEIRLGSWNGKTARAATQVLLCHGMAARSHVHRQEVHTKAGRHRLLRPRATSRPPQSPAQLVRAAAVIFLGVAVEDEAAQLGNCVTVSQSFLHDVGSLASCSRL